jgi:hypothetical protein
MHPPPRTPPGESGRTPPVPAPGRETRGCLFALSQPPLMLFLAVIGVLLALCGAHDLLML